MNFTLLEMLYNIPELQTLSYQLYRQMPDRISREAHLAEVWAECDAVSTPELEALFDRLADAENFVNSLNEQASFFTGLFLGWNLSQSLNG